MPKLSFEVMLVSHDKHADKKEISIEQFKSWFENSDIIFQDSIEEQEQKVNFVSSMGQIPFIFEMKEYKSKEYTSASLLKFTSQTNVYKPKIFLYDNFLKQLKIIVSRHYCNSYFLTRELSRHYSKELYEIFNNFEISLRKLIHLVFFNNFGHLWETKLFDKNILGMLKSNMKSNESDHIIEEMDLSDIETLLFREIVIECRNESSVNYKIMQNIGTYNQPEYILSPDFVLNNVGSFRRFSLWDEFFSKNMKKEFHGSEFIENFTKMRKIRNKVAHNKKVIYSDFIFINTFLKKFTKEMNLLSATYNEKDAPKLSPYLADAIQNSITPLSETIGHLKSSELFKISQKIGSMGINSELFKSLEKIRNLGINPEILKSFEKIGNMTPFSENQIPSNSSSNLGEIDVTKTIENKNSK